MDDSTLARLLWTFQSIVGFLLCAALLAGCQGPMDQPLNTGSTIQAYRASIDPIVEKMTTHERNAYEWAVEGIPNIATLHARYPNGSPRDIIRARVSEVQSSYSRSISKLESSAKASASVRQDLEKVVASEGRLVIENDFFGPQPRIKVFVRNGSSRPISSLQWQASLYLDNAKTSVATTLLAQDFKNDGGFKPEQSYSSTFTVGFVRGDDAWTTLEVRNAEQRRVLLEPVLDSIRDFGDRPYLANDAVGEIKALREAKRAADSYSDI